MPKEQHLKVEIVSEPKEERKEDVTRVTQDDSNQEMKDASHKT